MASALDHNTHFRSFCLCKNAGALDQRKECIGKLTVTLLQNTTTHSSELHSVGNTRKTLHFEGMGCFLADPESNAICILSLPPYTSHQAVAQRDQHQESETFCLTLASARGSLRTQRPTIAL
jgi:hypothetical protein